MFVYCYEVFRDLSARRSNSGFGINPLSYAEILAYKTLLSIDLYVWEIKIIIQLDEWLIEYVTEEEKKKSKK